MSRTVLRCFLGFPPGAVHLDDPPTRAIQCATAIGRYRHAGDFGQDVAVQPDGKIIAAGFGRNGAGSELVLARLR